MKYFYLYFTRFSSRIKISSILLNTNPDKWLEKTIIVAGWIKALRIFSKNEFAFVELNDGSCVNNLQAIISSNIKDFDFFQKKSQVIGASLILKGKVVRSLGGKQPVIA